MGFIIFSILYIYILYNCEDNIVEKLSTIDEMIERNQIDKNYIGCY
jgi:hypothetical protein